MIFLTGANGQVGHELRHTLASLGSVVATTRADLDLSDESAIRAAVRAASPRVIVNAAAYTAVDAAESDVAACTWLNVDVPRILAEEADRCGAWLVHYSTDYVFDGTGSRPYRETDPVAPLGVYGRTKADGEAAVRAACARHLIIRVAWVYGLRGKNFLLTVQRLAAGGGPLRIVSDQVGVPTWSRAIAEGTAGMVRAVMGGGANSGLSNGGYSNIGYSNIGYSNSGHSNSGHSNIGHSNGGHSNGGGSNHGGSNNGMSNNGMSNNGMSNNGMSKNGESKSDVELAGTYHLSGEGACSWHEFATEIVQRSGLQPLPEIRAISTAEFPTPAKRPAYSVLSAEKCRATFGISLPHWRDQLAACLAADPAGDPASAT